jgi:hypothetical protein
MSKAEQLILAYNDLTWDNFIIISDAIVDIDRNNIEGELEKLPTSYAHWAGLLAKSKRDLDTASLELTQYMASKRKGFADTSRSSGKKATAKDLDDFVMSQEDYKNLSLKSYKASEKYQLIKGLVSSLDHKANALVQLSSNRRAEIKLYS